MRKIIKRKDRGPKVVDLTKLHFLKRRRELVEPRPWPMDAESVEVLVFKTVQFRGKKRTIHTFSAGETIKFTRMALSHGEYSFYGFNRGISQGKLVWLVETGHLMVLEPK